MAFDTTISSESEPEVPGVDMRGWNEKDDRASDGALAASAAGHPIYTASHRHPDLIENFCSAPDHDADADVWKGLKERRGPEDRHRKHQAEPGFYVCSECDVNGVCVPLKLSSDCKCLDVLSYNNNADV